MTAIAMVWMQQPRWRLPGAVLAADAVVDTRGILGASLTHGQYMPVSQSARQLPAAAAL